MLFFFRKTADLFAMWRRSVLIHFSRLFMFSVFSVGKGAFLIILGAWAFLGRLGRPVVWKHCFSKMFMSKSMVFGVEGVPSGDIFRAQRILG